MTKAQGIHQGAKGKDPVRVLSDDDGGDEDLPLASEGNNVDALALPPGTQPAGDKETPRPSSDDSSEDLAVYEDEESGEQTPAEGE